ncbi:uncharacterized protein LOC133530661 isoform X2 [Cydia pomonella]|uniref:uncharacterized protein LOC133530661 isoform X2 n=1 Tax=Cydia pomonella TaxID=82600 RepID=UPI002ADE2CBF|nr:uncharacterized protein LOC133530661 isoform X2 [Cydia pomonella]
MPDPNKKISTPSQDSPCEIKLACTSGTEEKKKTCEKTLEIEKVETQKAKAYKSVDDKQARLNTKPCPSGVGCQLARPDHTKDPAARIDKTKSGCIDFESCEEEEQLAEEKKLESGCLDYEDCEDYLREEKRRIKQKKEEEKQKRKEKLAKARAENS